MKRLLSALIFGLLSLVSLASAAVIEQVTIDTTPIANVNGYLAFDLLGGIPLQKNTVTISNFATTGMLGGASRSGNVTGTLGSSAVVLTADQFFNEYLQGIKFSAGKTSFQIALTNNFAAASTPDSFSFFLLDNSLSPYATSDPSGANSFFAIDLTGAPAPQVFTSTFATVTLTPVIGSAPEPITGVLLAAGLAALVVWQRKVRN